jgi:hypothetical protein
MTMSDNAQLLSGLKKQISNQLYQEILNAVYHEDQFDHIKISNGLCGSRTVIVDDSRQTIEIEFTKMNDQIIFDSWELKRKESQTPTHYGTDKTDPISYMKLHHTFEQVEGFLLGNIIKYATRANKKNGVEDYKKLAHYAQMLLEHAEGEMKG